MEIYKRNFENYLIAVLCFIFSAILSLYLGQDANWDLRNYHFYNPYAFINNRIFFDFAPAQLQSFHSPFLDIPFYLMIRNFSPTLYGFLLGGLHGINIFIIYKISWIALSDVDKFNRQMLSILSGLTGFLGAANLSEIGTCFHDNTLSIPLLLGLLIIISAIIKSESNQIDLPKKSLFIVGLLFGISVGLKLTMAIYSLALAGSLLALANSFKSAIKNIFNYGFGLAIGFLMSMGYWAYILWEKFKNPLFPYYNKFFKSPFFDHINFVDERFFPRDIYQLVFYPFYFTKYNELVSEVPFRDIRFAVCYILFFLMSFVIFYRWVCKRHFSKCKDIFFFFDANKSKLYVFFLVFFILSYIIWQSLFSIYRYLVPLELLSSIFMILVIWHIFPIEKLFKRIAIITFVLVVIATNPMNWGRKVFSENFFDLKIESNLQIENATVIMVSKNPPHAYIIPYFPISTKFVHINSNLFNLKLSQNLFVFDKIIKKIEKSKNLYVLCNENKINEYDEILRSYNLEMERESLKIKIPTKFDKDLILISAIKVKD